MTAETSGNKLPVRTKLFYGVGDVGNALVNSALQFFLLIWYPITRRTHNEVLAKLKEVGAS